MQEELNNSMNSETNMAASYASLHSQHRLSRASDRINSGDNLHGSMARLTSKDNENSQGAVALAVRKIVIGLLISIFVCAFWIINLQCIKYTYMWNTSPVFYVTPGPVQTTAVTNATTELDSNATSLTTTTSPVTTYFSVSTNNSTTRTSQFHSADIPFFFTYLSVSSMALFYPLYLLFCCCCLAPDRHQLHELHKLNMIVMQGELSKKRMFFCRCLVFTMLWILTTYCCHQSLRKITPMEMAAIFAVQPSFSYLLSWVLLQKKFLGIRIIAFILGASGVILNIYVEQPIMWFKVLAALSGAFYAIFNILLERTLIIYIPHIGQILLILSTVGICTMLTTWPLIIILNFVTSVETGLDATAPWFLIAAVAPAYCLLIITLRIGRIFTYDIFINLGFFFALVFDGALEILYLKTVRLSDLVVGQVGDMHLMKLAGICLIVAGFFLTYVPAGWHQYLAKLCHIMPRNNEIKTEKVTRGMRI